MINKKNKKPKNTEIKILPNIVPVIQEMMISTAKQYKKAVAEHMKWISDAPKRDRVEEESCFSEFHKHFNPRCKKTYPLNELITYTHKELMWVLQQYEENCFRTVRKRILKAIPDCSRVLGSEPWTYSNSYSGKQAMEIYIYFLLFFLNQHPYDVTNRRSRCCEECESKRSEKEWRYQFFILKYMEHYKLHGCFECRQYFCKKCDTKILFKELYRDLNNMNMFSKIKCENCFKIITEIRFKAGRHLRLFQQKKRKLNMRNPPNRYGDLLYYYISDDEYRVPILQSSSVPVSISDTCSIDSTHTRRRDHVFGT